MTDFELFYENDRLFIRSIRLKNFKPICVDFLSTQISRRAKTAPHKRQLFTKAIGFKKEPWRVFDATLGLGKDAYILACMGCTVIACEQSPLVYKLVADGFRRAQLKKPIQLFCDDSKKILQNIKTEDRPDVIYLDPMFPQAGKTALSQKDMQILQTLIASDESADKDLLQVALTVAKARVVVKRPRRAPPILANVQQSYSGRTVRYDVYFHI